MRTAGASTYTQELQENFDLNLPIRLDGHKAMRKGGMHQGHMIQELEIACTERMKTVQHEYLVDWASLTDVF
jgi:hypothetical protein